MKVRAGRMRLRIVVEMTPRGLLAIGALTASVLLASAAIVREAGVARSRIVGDGGSGHA